MIGGVIGVVPGAGGFWIPGAPGVVPGKTPGVPVAGFGLPLSARATALSAIASSCGSHSPGPPRFGISTSPAITSNAIRAHSQWPSSSITRWTVTRRTGRANVA